MAGIIVKPRSRIYHGHDWVYSSEVLKAWGEPQDGEVIVIKDGKDRLLGSAIYNSKSQIIARRFSRQKQDIDLDFLQRRIAQSLMYRKRRECDPLLSRLVWSESDGLPGLIVDRYGDYLVVQTLTMAMDKRREEIANVLQEQINPKGIVERNDAPIRIAEGLELRTGMLRGESPAPFVIRAAGLDFEIDLLHGQKTGFYLDQIASYPLVARFAKGRRVLDCFANQGAFALACKKAGATSATAVEISADACAQIRANARRNELEIEVVERNAFDFLKLADNNAANDSGAYDLIVLDPPSFTKSRGKLDDALRGYKEIHLRALKLLAPGGILATFCCSHHVTREHLMGAINEAAVDSRRTLRQLETYSQAPDHPIITTMPETEYLKGYLFELAPGR